MIGWLCHNKPRGTKLDGTKCRAASGGFSVSDLDVKCVMVRSTSWWQGGMGEEEVPQAMSPKDEPICKTSLGSIFFFSGGCWRNGEKSPDPHRWYRGTSPSPGCWQMGLSCGGGERLELFPKSHCAHSLLLRSTGGMANMPAPRPAGSCLSPYQDCELPPLGRAHLAPDCCHPPSHGSHRVPMTSALCPNLVPDCCCSELIRAAVS